MFLGSASAGIGMIICVIVTQNVTQANAYTRTVTYLRALQKIKNRTRFERGIQAERSCL